MKFILMQDPSNNIKNSAQIQQPSCISASKIGLLDRTPDHRHPNVELNPC